MSFDPEITRNDNEEPQTEFEAFQLEDDITDQPGWVRFAIGSSMSAIHAKVTPEQLQDLEKRSGRIGD